MQKVSKVAKKYLEEKSKKENIIYDDIGYGDLDDLGEVFQRANIKIKINHPLNRNQAVLDALDRESKRSDALFVKGYIRYGRLYRIFTIK